MVVQPLPGSAARPRFQGPRSGQGGQGIGPLDPCDLVLEGGGVKALGLVGALQELASAGYEPRRIAGSSAGAIVGALLAAGETPAELHELWRDFDFTRFADESLLDRFGPPGKALSVLFEKGIYEGDALRDWIAERLERRGVRTWADLRLGHDPEASLPPEARWNLVVLASDVGRGRLVRLPWDYPDYGLDPDSQSVADAVRASASIPFFFEPVSMRTSGGDRTLLVDGGLVSNFPIWIFDRQDRKPPRWPTFGIKLSARPDARQRPRSIATTFHYGAAIVATMLGAQDQAHLDDPCVVARTVFVDTAKVTAVDFDLAPDARRELYEGGRRAAAKFLKGWDFEDYVARCRK